MKKSFSKLVLIMFSLLLFSTQCDEDTSLTKEDEEQQLTALKIDIEDLANTSICSDTFECKFIPFGSKPCGGSWNYLVYSTSIDTEQLETMVENYNRKEDLYNTEWNIASDCTIVNPPTSVNCENNTCVAVY